MAGHGQIRSAYKTCESLINYGAEAHDQMNNLYEIEASGNMFKIGNYIFSTNMMFFCVCPDFTLCLLTVIL
jgi:hypothetical protein